MYAAELVKYADFEWATKLNRLSLNIIGIWPHTHENASDRFLSNLHATVALLIIIFAGLIPGMYSLTKLWNDMIAIIDNLQFTMPVIMSVMKLMIVWWKMHDLTLVLNTVANDWAKSKTDKELYIMTKHAQNARIITTFGCIFVILAFILLIILPCVGISVMNINVANITEPIKILPIQNQFFYDTNRSPYYELTYAAQVLLLIMCGTTYTSVDNLFGVLIFHLCGQMENLKERIINIKQFKNFNSGVTLIVKDHIRLIKYFSIVENAFTLLLLAILIYFGILFCLHGFLTIGVLTEGKEMSTMRLIFLICALIITCGHMGLQCVIGEILVTHCEGVYYAVFDYEWYKLEPDEARILILIMIRASKPLHITAGKIFPMTLSTFCNLMKTSCGYISVLLARQSS